MASIARTLRAKNRDFKLPLVLRFSNRRMAAELNGTIWQHYQLLTRRGHCWWGWWRAQNALDLGTDPSDAFNQLVASGPAYIGLFSKSLGRAYVAKVDRVVTNHGAPILTPEREATPAYYSSEAFPAWFRLTELHRIDGARITQASETVAAESGIQIETLEDLFRNLENVEQTIVWLDDKIEPSLPTLEDITGPRILHISDLHFGAHHAWESSATSHPAKLTLADAIEKTLEQHKIDPTTIGVIVASGDISDQGPTEDRYDDALAFFRRLFSFTELSAKNLVITPGNHDVTRHVVDGAEGTFDFSQRQYDDRLRQAEEPYRAFCDELFGQPSVISRIRRFRSPASHLNFLQLNSTLPRDQYTKEYGFLGLAPLRQLDTLRQIYSEALGRNEASVNIAVQHHHVISTVKAEYVPLPRDTEIHDPVSTMVDQSNLIDWCTQYKIRLLLHGHQHKLKCRMISDRFSNHDSPFITDIIGAGSAGATWRADREEMSFNLYDVNTDRIRFRALGMDREMARLEPLRDFHIPTSGEMTP